MSIFFVISGKTEIYMRWLLMLVIVLHACDLSSQVKPALGGLLNDFPNVRDFTMTIYGDEAYFTVQSPLGEISTILRSTKENGSWSDPTIASFSGKFHDLEPFITSDGLTIYFASNRPLESDNLEIKDYDIWYAERSNKKSAWGKPMNLGAPINTAGNEFYPSLSNNGNIYFTSDGEGTHGLDDIFFSKYENGEYASPVALDSTINSEGYEFNAYVAPDESYLIFTGYDRLDGMGSGDLYLSRLDEDGKWSHAMNMGVKINSAQMDYCPYVDVQNQELYFTSRRSNITSSLDYFKSIQELKKIHHGYQNGQSRLYQVSIKDILK